MMPLRGSVSRRLRVWIFLAASCLLAASAPAATEADAPPIKDAVRDDTGRVWGMAKDGPRPGLYIFDGSGRWEPATPSGIGKEARPCCLGRRADGTVACVWKLENFRCRTSVHHGQDESRLGQPFTMGEGRYFLNLRLTADSKNNLWLTQDGPDIFRLKPDGAAECLHTLTAEECLPGTMKDGATSNYWPMISTLEDADGRTWFWTDHADGGSNGATIRGALVYDGDKFVQHDFMMPDGGPQKSLTALARKDAQHLWFARFFDGLYTLDISTFHAERVPDQPTEASMTSLAVQGVCGAWHFIMGQNRPEGGCTLWRLDGNGHWEKRLDGVDAHYDFSHQQDRVWGVTDGGEYLGTNANGMWFLPCDGSAPRHADWRQRFPLATPHRFIDLQNGRWLGVSTGGVTWVGSPETLWAEQASPDNGRIRILRVDAPLRADARGHLWGTFASNSPVLHEWDGANWTEHALPSELGATSFMGLLNLDAAGRIWLRSFSQQKRVAIYDPSVDHWQVFDSFEAALEAQNGNHDAEFATARERFDLPRFGPEGRICFLTERWKVMAHADRAWRQWSRGEITGETGSFAFDGAPFIDRAGRISVNAERKTWEFVEGGAGWHAVAYEPGFDDNDTFFAARRWNQPTDDKLPFQPDSAVRDNQGAWWLTWQRGLYKFRDGRWAAVLRADETQPFTDGRRLEEVLIDGRGNAFLSNGDHHGEYVILAPPGPPPRTTASPVVENRAEPAATPRERMMVRLTTDAGALEGKVRFDWRLDSGPWNALNADGPEAVVTLDSLPGGSHHFEARSFDAALQTDATVATLDFDLHPDPDQQIAEYIAQLSDPDYSRRASAARALARQPARARPALRAARTKADENQRWWIDAALQEIENAGP